MLKEGLVAIVLIAGLWASDVIGAQHCNLISCNRVSYTKIIDNIRDPLIGKPIALDKGLCVANYSIDDGCEPPPTDACDRTCQPQAMERVNVQGRNGPVTKEVIKFCYASNDSCIANCVRKPKYIFMFTGSKYQKRVDVGKCVGQCQGKGPLIQCKPIRTHSEAIQGPNGVTILSVTDECNCSNTNCYRADYFESFTELIPAPDNFKNNTKRVEKLINVGRCVGSCPGVFIPGRCYPSSENCILRLPPTKAKCAVIEGEENKFIGVDHKERSVPSIKSCGCGTG